MIDRIHASQLPVVRLALILAFVVLAAGCGLFNPDKPKIDPPEPFKYRDLSTPQNVLFNLRDSWERKDSVRTAQIYDDNYLGHSTDNTGTIDFFKVDEVLTVGGLARDQNVSSITFTLPDSTTWVRQDFASDPPGWTDIQLRAYNIQVDDAVKGTLIAHPSPGSTFEFKFVPTLDAASPTDTTWKIIRWQETLPSTAP